MVASSQELRRARHPHNKAILVEHGAGQVYKNDRSNAYSDGKIGYENVVGFVCSTDTVFQRRRQLFPNIPSVLAGVPKLDKFSLFLPEIKTACLTFHWDCSVSQESGCGFPYFLKAIKAALPIWRAQGWTIYGHYHPRQPSLISEYKKLGIPVLHTEEEVFNTCSVLIADNTSLLFEFMGLGRPVLFLRSPYWRPRDISETQHGLRFWDVIDHGYDEVGPADLPCVSLDNLSMGDDWTPYGDLIDGRASERAAQFIVDILATT